MRGWIIKNFANPKEALQLAELPEPTIGQGMVKIRVEAVALNYFDIL
jgi:NADPH:quinone reductase